MFGGGFDKSKLRANLAMSQQRMKLVRSKRTNELRIERKGIGEMVRRMALPCDIRVKRMPNSSHVLPAAPRKGV
jgi:hypothetical protein